MNFKTLSKITNKQIKTLKQAFWRKGLSIKNEEDIEYYLNPPKIKQKRKERSLNYLKKYQFKKNGIPPRLFQYFWYCNPRTLDIEKDKEDIIRKILDYGDHKALLWIFKKYGAKLIKDVYLKTIKTYFKAQSILLCDLILEVKHT